MNELASRVCSIISILVTGRHQLETVFDSSDHFQLNTNLLHFLLVIPQLQLGVWRILTLSLELFDIDVVLLHKLLGTTIWQERFC